MASSTAHFAYHVFLSFRGKDTRKTFTDHLYTALVNAGIRTFRDDDELERGEDVAIALMRAIERSRLSIIVLSKVYASSGWCLDELVKILECKKEFGQIVLPIFYDVDPLHVRLQIGSFEEAFVRHEERVRSEVDQEKRRKRVEKVKQWRAALSEVADLHEGKVLKDEHDGFESRFIQDIVKIIGKRLRRTIIRAAPYPVGIDSRVKDIEAWLEDESYNARILVIYGIGGIGKTTLAKTIFNLYFDKFDASSFVLNVRETYEQPYGLARVQRQVLSDILQRKVQKTYNVDEGTIKIRNVICCKRILLVLDDVNDMDQINAILGERESLHPGSKIIITTRHDRLLVNEEELRMYKVRELDSNESIHLFSWHAFKQNVPAKSYTNLSMSIVKDCGGIPLALQVLGSSLYGRSLDVWESAIKKLEAIPHNKILEKLRISYDSLPDSHDKNLFLDITCFFTGKRKGYVLTILNSDFYAIAGIQNLVDRCLLTIEKNQLELDERLMMHQLIRDMGREIVRQESPQNPGERSRLWNHKDSFNVLREKIGTVHVQGLVFDMKKLEVDKSKGTVFGMDFKNLGTDKSEVSSNVSFETDAFVNIQKLRLLKMSYVKFSGSYNKLFERLRWLYWRGFALKSIPNELPLKSVVALDMRNSKLERVWNGIKHLGLLQILNLSNSIRLRHAPDFSSTPNLKILNLKNCIRLIELHESIGLLLKLVTLNLRGCKDLSRLPRTIGELKSLEELFLTGCSNLTELPVELSRLQSLTTFHADEVPFFSSDECPVKSWHEYLTSWVWKPTSFTREKFTLASLSRSLETLSLVDCNLPDSWISMDLSSLSSLRLLNLTGNLISTIPESIKNLALNEIWLDECSRLQSLPELPSSITILSLYKCRSLTSIKNVPNPIYTMSWALKGCVKVTELQGFFKLDDLSKFDDELIKTLGFFDFESVENIEILLGNRLAGYFRKFPILQGLYEFEIFSTFIPGSISPSWLVSDAAETSVSLIVPSDPTAIRGLNICIVYSRSHLSDAKIHFYIKISNRTKGLKWVYGPTFIGIPGPGEDMSMLCHWGWPDKFEQGDALNVALIWHPDTPSRYYFVKRFGACIVYKHEDEDLAEGKSKCDKSNSGHDMSEYMVRTNECFLSFPDLDCLLTPSSGLGFDLF